MPELRIGGFVPLSTVDWPGEMVATVFAQGCPWNCPYCHNPHLLQAGEGRVPWSEVLELLESRRGLLDGAVFSGGEPTLQPEILSAVCTVREMGFKIGMHTGGPFPERLEELLPHLDWVGFDVKAPFDEYERITRVPGSGAHALASLRALVASSVPFQARTTVHPALLDDAALARIAAELAAEGVGTWTRQEFRGMGVREGELSVSDR
jgi:pyruvate formate lyase activating enzyme